MHNPWHHETFESRNASSGITLGRAPSPACNLRVVIECSIGSLQMVPARSGNLGTVNGGQIAHEPGTLLRTRQIWLQIYTPAADMCSVLKVVGGYLKSL